MATEEKVNKNSFSLDWLIGGILAKLGYTVDQFTGRNWNPSSSLATSELVERLKFLLDSEVRDLGEDGKFVPHVIQLKMQWNKFSTEAEDELEKLEHELLAAAIDHINDKLYHTYAPLEIEIKNDYFTEGVRMLATFGKYAEANESEAAISVTVPDLNADEIFVNDKFTVDLSGGALEKSAEPQAKESKDDTFFASFVVSGRQRKIELDFAEKKRISVGRFKENDLSIPDQSVSKVHASLVLNEEKQMLVADTGSTNGTFAGVERIAYGKAVPVEDGATIKFGTVDVRFERAAPLESEFEEDSEPPESEKNAPENIEPKNIEPEKEVLKNSTDAPNEPNVSAAPVEDLPATEFIENPELARIDSASGKKTEAEKKTENINASKKSNESENQVENENEKSFKRENSSNKTGDREV